MRSGILIALFATAACVADTKATSDTVVVDSAGVTIITMSGELLKALPTWHATDVSDRLGFAPGESAPLDWHMVSGMQITGDGDVAITSDGAKQILWSNPSRGVEGRRGRMGRGPGEFQHLTLIPSEDRSQVTVYDALQRRLSFVRRDTTPISSVSLAGVALGGGRPLFRFANGDLLMQTFGPQPKPAASGVVREEDLLRRATIAGDITADFGRHAAADRVLRLVSADRLTGGEPPFARQLLIGATDSTVYVASTGPYEFSTYRQNGQLLSRVRVHATSRQVTAAMRVAYRHKVLDGVTDAYGQREWTMLSADDVFPDYLPAFDALLTDDHGRLWIRETPDNLTPTGTAHWVVFAANRPVAELSLPAAFTVLDVAGDRIAGMMRTEGEPVMPRLFRLSR